jgi:flagellar protein FlaJ
MASSKLDQLKSGTDKKSDNIREGREIDIDAVESIVSKLKKQDESKGIGKPVIEEHLRELRDIISEGKLATLDIDTNSKLITGTESPTEARVVKLYHPFKNIINKFASFILKNPLGKKISFYLYSANIKKTLLQHLIFSIIFSLITSAAISIGLFILFTFYKPIFLLLIPVIFILSIFFFIFIYAYLVPMSKAKKRGKEIDTELPYALRHLATELQAGMGLYKVLQSIAQNDYGVLSDEMSRIVLEIDHGTDTRTALRRAALRSQSKSFNIAISHIVRTLNTGGNLAETINSVADSVSFDLMEAVRGFGEKMNFFGIIFIFVAIVMPVFVAILGGIANAPLGQGGTMFLQGMVSTTIMEIIFLIALPAIFAFLIYYIKSIEPKI